MDAGKASKPNRLFRLFPHERFHGGRAVHVSLWSEMLLHPREFVRLLNGRYRCAEGERRTNAVVGFLPLHLGGFLPTLSTDIRLGVEYAKKLIGKHSLSYDEISVISELIEDSYCFREKPGQLTFMGYSTQFGKPYTLVLKTARNGTETWISTLHRTDHQQLKSKVRRSKAKDWIFREPRAAVSEWD